MVSSNVHYTGGAAHLCQLVIAEHLLQRLVASASRLQLINNSCARRLLRQHVGFRTHR